MTDYMEIGPTPSEEPCEQTGRDYRPDVARAECRLFIRAIKLECGEPPEGASLVVRSNPHDFGTYYEVAVRYDDNNSAAVDYAFRVENEAPDRWPESLRAEAEGLRASAGDRPTSRSV